jgi:hypothetical protein
MKGGELLPNYLGGYYILKKDSNPWSQCMLAILLHGLMALDKELLEKEKLQSDYCFLNNQLAS